MAKPLIIQKGDQTTSVGVFAGDGLPKSLMLWSSAILWFVATLANLLYIRKNS